MMSRCFAYVLLNDFVTKFLSVSALDSRIPIAPLNERDGCRGSSALISLKSKVAKLSDIMLRFD